MSQRSSGYERRERDCYETPEWVTEALLPHIPRDIVGIWEPAAGSGKIARVLVKAAHSVTSTDITGGYDFLECEHAPNMPNAIVTNPPYTLAARFIAHALDLMKPVDGMVAMLLRTDFDHAAGRRCLFLGCPAFAKKLVLTKRIKWFEDSKGQPSFNHAWFLWDWTHKGPPVLAYGP